MTTYSFNFIFARSLSDHIAVKVHVVQVLVL